MRRNLVLLAILITLVAPAQKSLEDALFKGAQPRLVVLISIDQFRPDYLGRFRDLYLPAKNGSKVGGFRYLMESGAWFVNARYKHIPTETGPGHAVMSTGGPPYMNGIVSNNWYDRATAQTVYCVADPTATGVGGGGKGLGPKNLLVSTYGDELKMATGGKSKNASISFKDRASILMAGRISDGVVWYEAGAKGWVTSSAYGTQLPAWAAKMNAETVVAQWKGKSWEKTLPSEAYSRCAAMDSRWVNANPTYGPKFPHKLPEDNGYHGQLRLTPFATQFTLDTAREAVTSLGMGQDGIPDSLTVSLSANDYVGHAFGPDSEEVLQLSVDTDRLLAEFFNWLNTNVPGGLDSVLIGITADHGATVNPELSISHGFPVGRVNGDNLMKSVETLLDTQFPGSTAWKLHFEEPWIFFDHSAARPRGTTPEDVANVIVRAVLRNAGVSSAYTRWQLMTNRQPDTEAGAAAARNFRPDRCGDVAVFLDPGWLYPGAATSHGQPTPQDMAVPILLRGPGIKKGIYVQRVSPEDIAPTICAILGISVPSGSVGNPIGLTGP